VKAAVLTWYCLRWPREVASEQVTQLCRLLATTAGTPVIIEAVGSPGLVEHRLALAPGRASSVVDQLRSAVPGLNVEAVQDRPALDISHVVELRLSTKRRSLRTDDLANVSRAILTALAHLHRNEHLSLQWLLGRSLPPTAVPNRLDGLGSESWLKALLVAPFGAPPQADVEVRNALRAKQAEPGWRAIGRLAVKADSPSREKQLVRQVIGALGSAAAPSVSFWVSRGSVKRTTTATAGWRLPLRLNVSELAIVSSFPAGATNELPVNMVGSRLVAPTEAIPRKGRIIGQASFPGRERPVALTPTDSLRHVHVIGPSGVGKSTLLLHLITQDIAARRGVVVLDPKGDLIGDVLARVAPERVNDVVVLDPTDDRPVGLNPLRPGGRSPELVADQLLGMWHAMYAESWGPRTHDILSASLLTLARTPGMTLAALPRLLTNAGFRRQIVSKVSDPIGLGPFWSTFENWSEGERATAISPVMNKLRPLLMRPEMRAIVGQTRPRFELRQVFTEKKVLLVNLAKGLLGPETSALLGSLVISQLWQAVLGRAAIAPEKRRPVFVVADEFQDYMRLPLDFADALAQARGLGASFALAHQFMHQLAPAMRSAVLANAQSRIAFRLPSEDARAIASGSALEPADFQSLGAYQAYAQLVAGGAIQPWASIATLPPSEPISDPLAVRAASRERYGVNRAEVEAELRELFVGDQKTSSDDLSPRRRKQGGLS
jgi:hypothetical protein